MPTYLQREPFDSREGKKSRQFIANAPSEMPRTSVVASGRQNFRVLFPPIPHIRQPFHSHPAYRKGKSPGSIRGVLKRWTSGAARPSPPGDETEEEQHRQPGE